jgi:hypothetical protein
MVHSITSSILNSFPYLSADVIQPRQLDHPQIFYSHFNKIDYKISAEFSRKLEEIACHWALLIDTNINDNFMRAICGLRQVIQSVSATSLMVIHCGELLVERPNLEMQGNSEQRRHEITKLIENTLKNWTSLSFDRRFSFSCLALLGITPLQIELVNYLDTVKVPLVLGNMLSRLTQINGSQDLEKIDVIIALQNFFELEQKILYEANLARISIPVITRPRIYVPQEAVSADFDAYYTGRESLKRANNRVDSILQFLSLLWKEFTDEALIILHEDDEINAYALVGGCCYHFHATVSNEEKTKVKGENKPQFIGTAGEYYSQDWRRSISRLSFEGFYGKKILDFRKNIIDREILPVDQREQEGRNGFISEAAIRLLNRQVNYNISHVLSQQMERISVDEWSPNMCRDQYGQIYNVPHAFGGVGEMFRGLLQYGGGSSQFRTWREMDGTHGFADMRRFIGYKTALDQFLLE